MIKGNFKIKKIERNPDAASKKTRTGSKTSDAEILSQDAVYEAGADHAARR